MLYTSHVYNIFKKRGGLWSLKFFLATKFLEFLQGACDEIFLKLFIDSYNKLFIVIPIR